MERDQNGRLKISELVDIKGERAILKDIIGEDYYFMTRTGGWYLNRDEVESMVSSGEATVIPKKGVSHE